MAVLASHAIAPAGVAGRLDSAVHRLDPRAKLVALLGVTVVAVITPLGDWGVFAACAVALAAVAAAAKVPPGVIWGRARVVLPLILFVAAFVPFLRPGGPAMAIGPLTVSAAGVAVFAGVAVKATIGTTAAVLLGATTPFPDLLRGLAALRVPRLPTLIAAVTYRYLWVVADDVRRMRIALCARAYRPRTLLRAGTIGRLVAALFLRTHARAERVHMAMLARGYDGTMPAAAPLRLGRADAAFVALVLGLALGARAAALGA